MVKSLNKKPLVSIVLPTRNRSGFLQKAIKSVNEQTFKDFEIIVIDDASTDDTPIILEGLKADSLKVIRNETPSGGGGARNQGIKEASGVLIAFLDDDDVWMPEKLKKQVESFYKELDCSLVTTEYYDVYPKKKPKLVKIKDVNDNCSLLEGNFLGGASMYLTSKANLDACGGFDKSLRSGQDWDLLIRLSQFGRIVVLHEPLVQYFSHDDIRISNNLLSSYTGYRNIYFKYKNVMPANLQRRHYTELLFWRLKMQDRIKIRYIIRILWSSLTLAFPYNMIFWLRFMRFVTVGK